jgi:GntR family transcriptional repressor for pyruvate dehydrogenase complex
MTTITRRRKSPVTATSSRRISNSPSSSLDREEDDKRPTTESWRKPIVQSLPDQISRVILGRIATGELLPGDKLPPQRELAQNLNVGMSAVREAIQRLEVLNIVDTQHGSGTVIKPFRWFNLVYDPSFFLMAAQHIAVRDLWEARHVIEAQIASLAAIRATKSDIALMREILVRADPYPRDYDLNTALNSEFHLAVAAASKNMVLRDMLAPLLEIRIAGVAHHYNDEERRKVWESHGAIYHAISEHDAEAAVVAVAKHFALGALALKEIVARSQVGKEQFGKGSKNARPPVAKSDPSNKRKRRSE